MTRHPVFTNTKSKTAYIAHGKQHTRTHRNNTHGSATHLLGLEGLVGLKEGIDAGCASVKGVPVLLPLGQLGLGFLGHAPCTGQGRCQVSVVVQQVRVRGGEGALEDGWAQK